MSSGLKVEVITRLQVRSNIVFYTYGNPLKLTVHIYKQTMNQFKKSHSNSEPEAVLV